MGRGAVLEVRDAGPGIPPDLLPRLFERFSGRQDLQGQGRGLGLGLYLARGIAEAHGGTLTVQSEPGNGAAVRLELPVHGETGGAMPSTGRAAEGSGPSPVLRRHRVAHGSGSAPCQRGDRYNSAVPSGAPVLPSSVSATSSAFEAILRRS